jgi:hypothetical protein
MAAWPCAVRNDRPIDEETIMTHRVRLALIVAGLACPCVPAAAQDFQPPASGSGASSSGVRFDLLGFSTRLGVDLSGGGSLVLGAAFDVAQLWSPQVRLRPSFEFSGSGTSTARHFALEVVYRFQPDRAPAIPYVGIGAGYFSQASTGRRTLWPTLVMGFELALRPSFNWLLEYHALDRLGRHRFLVGLSTRGGGGD